MNIMELFVNAFVAFGGVALGWYLNEKSIEKRMKPKFVCSLTYIYDDELTPRSMRTKNSETEYGIEFFNVGGSPFIVDIVSLVYNDKLLVDGICFDDKNRIIAPNTMVAYKLMNQDVETLENYLRQNKLTQITVKLNGMDGCVLKCSLDVSFIRHNMDLADNLIISLGQANM